MCRAESDSSIALPRVCECCSSRVLRYSPVNQHGGFSPSQCISAGKEGVGQLVTDDRRPRCRRTTLAVRIDVAVLTSLSMSMDKSGPCLAIGSWCSWTSLLAHRPGNIPRLAACPKFRQKIRNGTSEATRIERNHRPHHRALGDSSKSAGPGTNRKHVGVAGIRPRHVVSPRSLSTATRRVQTRPSGPLFRGGVQSDNHDRC